MRVMGMPYMVFGMEPGYYIIEILFPQGTRYIANVLDADGTVQLFPLKEQFVRDLWNIRLVHYQFRATFDGRITNVYKWG
jgi:hypothetical protein